MDVKKKHWLYVSHATWTPLNVMFVQAITDHSLFNLNFTLCPLSSGFAPFINTKATGGHLLTNINVHMDRNEVLYKQRMGSYFVGGQAVKINCIPFRWVCSRVLILLCWVTGVSHWDTGWNWAIVNWICVTCAFPPMTSQIVEHVEEVWHFGPNLVLKTIQIHTMHHTISFTH